MTTHYPTVPGFVAGSDTSQAAAASIDARSMRAQAARLLFVAETNEPPGLTSDELERLTMWPHQTASARLRELVLGGFAYDSDDRRPTRHGRLAVVRRLVIGQLSLFEAI